MRGTALGTGLGGHGMVEARDDDSLAGGVDPQGAQRDGRRQEEGPDAVQRCRIAAAARAVEDATESLRQAVRSAREAGLTWATIGEVLGVTKQAAHERFGRSRGRSS